MTSSQLSTSVESVLSLVDKMTTALQWDISISNVSTVLTTHNHHLRSSSLSELTAHTKSIHSDIASVIGVTRKVAEECTIRSISDNIKASLSKMTTLSHQLFHVARVRLRYCQGENMCLQYQVLITYYENVADQSEETATLVDLVESGANLLNTVNYLLKDVCTVSEISGSRKCTSKSMYVSS